MLLQACSNVIIMDQGRIRAAGPTRKVMEAMAKARADSGAPAKAVPLKVIKVDPPTQNEITDPAEQ